VPDDSIHEPLNRERLIEQLILHEGLRPRLYRCTSGKLTIGVGYNVDDRGVGPLSETLGRAITVRELEVEGLSKDESLQILNADITRFEQQILKRFPLYARLNEPRKRAVLDFTFNIGTTRAAAFKKAIEALKLAIEAPDPRVQQAFFHETAWHAMDSLWARQVDDGLAGSYGRADRIADMMRTGLDYTR
jgi:lysozyme